MFLINSVKNTQWNITNRFEIEIDVKTIIVVLIFQTKLYVLCEWEQLQM